VYESLEFTLSSGAVPLTVLGIILLTGTTVGRLFCGWACPFGMIQDFLSYLPFSKKRLDGSLGKYLKDVKWVILGVSLFCALVIGFRREDQITVHDGAFSISFFNVFSPSVTLFAYLPYLIVWKSHALVDAGLLGLLKFSFFILSILPAIFIPRFFCRYLCPLGALLSPFGSFKFLRISRATSLSSETLNKTLYDVCPMGVVASEVSFLSFFFFFFYY
jgi:ferredoxin-type protein NapH